MGSSKFLLYHGTVAYIHFRRYVKRIDQNDESAIDSI